MLACLRKIFVSRRSLIIAGVGLFLVAITVNIAVVMAGNGQKSKPASERTIVVVGGGMAGLAAVLEASKKSARVILIEGEKFTGGNSAKATSGINGCQTKAQKALGIVDSHDLFFDDTLKAGHGENDKTLLDVLVHKAAESVEFLNGLDMNLSQVSIGGGHSVPRTHAFSMPPDGKLKPFGATVMRTVFSKLQEFKSGYEAIGLNDRLQVFFETKAVSLIMSADDPNRVVGVRVRSVADNSMRDIEADAVILATGGFCNDHDPQTSLLAKYAGDKIKYPTTNGPFADGSGMKMAENVGANLIDMEKIQIHPTGFVDPSNPKAPTKFLAAEALRGSGAVLLNEKGRRFANELGLRDYLTGEILKHCALNETSGTHTAWMVLNQEAVDEFGRPAFEFYWKIKKFFKMVNNLNELADMISVPIENLLQTLDDYNKAKNGQGPDPFGKKVFPVNFSPDQTMYVGTITPVLHYSMGGIKVNSNAQVLNKKTSKPIVGLYAAGEVIGGVHGNNRLSGNSYLDCVVFGRIAGVHAAEDKF